MLSMARLLRLTSILLLPFLVAFGCEDSTGRLTTQTENDPGNSPRRHGGAEDLVINTIDNPTIPAVSPCLRGESSSAIWHVVFIQGVKVGSRQTTEKVVERNGQTVIETTVCEHIELVREGQRSVVDVKIVYLDTQDGDMIQVKYPLLLGTETTRMQATVEGDALRIRSLSDDRPPTEMPWPEDARGPLCIERSLRDRPMRPDEIRTLRMFLPAICQTVEATLQAADWETTQLLTGEKRLLRINARTRLTGDAEMTSTIWTNADGTILKDTQTVGVEVTTYRTTRETALANGENQPLDLFQHAIISVDSPLVSPHSCQEIEYEISSPHSDPAKLFCSNERQRIQPIGPNSARLIVHASDGENTDKLTDADLAASPLAQSDAPRIRELAESVLPDVDDSRRVAIALEKLVYRLIEEKSYGQVFASATEVLDSHAGDCTEHSVLLVALCRARSIPARAAMGLVYSEPHQAFAYHMWTEAWTGNRWLSLDATRGDGRIGPAHLKMATSHLAGPAALVEMMTTLQNVNGLTIKATLVEE